MYRLQASSLTSIYSLLTQPCSFVTSNQYCPVEVISMLGAVLPLDHLYFLKTPFAARVMVSNGQTFAAVSRKCSGRSAMAVINTVSAPLQLLLSVTRTQYFPTCVASNVLFVEP